MEKRIFSIDDHQIIHYGLRSVFESTQDISLIGAAHSLDEALELIPNSGKIDLILLDITMPKTSGMSALRVLKAQFPDIPVAIFSAQPEALYGANSSKLKAVTYIEKGFSVKEIVEKVYAVLYGKINVSYNKAQEKNKKEKPLFKRLSVREAEVLKLLTAGKRNKVIAEELGLDEKTISTYKHRVLKKFNVSSTIELINHSSTLDFFKE